MRSLYYIESFYCPRARVKRLLKIIKKQKITFKSHLACVRASQSYSKLIHHAIISIGYVSRNDSNFMRNLNCNPLTFLTCTIKGQNDSKKRWLSFSTTFFSFIWFISIQLWTAWTTTVSRQQRKSPVDSLMLKIISHSFLSRQRHTHVTATIIVLLLRSLNKAFRRKRKISF